jgi:hypothetical protein
VILERCLPVSSLRLSRDSVTAEGGDDQLNRSRRNKGEGISCSLLPHRLVLSPATGEGDEYSIPSGKYGLSL